MYDGLLLHLCIKLLVLNNNQFKLFVQPKHGNKMWKPPKPDQAVQKVDNAFQWIKQWIAQFVLSTLIHGIVIYQGRVVQSPIKLTQG